MEKMLNELCGELNNWFCRQKIHGKFVIKDGSLVDFALQDGQYFRIVNSVFNDGVYKYPVSDLKDEKFEGAIWSMAIPQDVIDLASEISAWKALYGGADSPAMSPYNAESFNGYSYSKGASNSASSGGSIAWQDAYSKRLNRYRKLRGAV